MSLMVSPGSKGGSSISANLLVSLRTYIKEAEKNKSLLFHTVRSLHPPATGRQRQEQQIFKDPEVLPSVSASVRSTQSTWETSAQSCNLRACHWARQKSLSEDACDGEAAGAGCVLWQDTYQGAFIPQPSPPQPIHHHKLNSLSTQLHTQPKGSVKAISQYHDAVNYCAEKLVVHVKESDRGVCQTPPPPSSLGWKLTTGRYFSQIDITVFKQEFSLEQHSTRRWPFQESTSLTMEA